MASSAELDVNDYQALAEFRYQIRKFLRFSEGVAREAGIEPQHHQLMLALKGLPDGIHATVGELAERLQIRHHSSVELIDRLTEQGLVQRRRSEQDRRQVLVALTATGRAHPARALDPSSRGASGHRSAVDWGAAGHCRLRKTARTHSGVADGCQFRPARQHGRGDADTPALNRCDTITRQRTVSSSRKFALMATAVSSEHRSEEESAVCVAGTKSRSYRVPHTAITSRDAGLDGRPRPCNEIAAVARGGFLRMTLTRCV